MSCLMFDYVYHARIPRDFVYMGIDKNSKFAKTQIQLTLRNTKLKIFNGYVYSQFIIFGGVNNLKLCIYKTR